MLWTAASGGVRVCLSPLRCTWSCPLPLQLLKWLLARLRPAPNREVDGNKQYASELLAILVQQSGGWGVRVGR